MKIQKRYLLLWALILSFYGNAHQTITLDGANYRFDISLLRADKEIKSIYVSDEEGNTAISEANFTSAPQVLASDIMEVIADSLYEVDQNPIACDQTLANSFVKNLKIHGFKNTFEASKRILKIVRHFNLIDDLFYNILLRNLELRAMVRYKLQIKEEPPKAVFYGKSTISRTKEIFGPVGGRWPDGVNACPTQALGKLLGEIKDKFDRDKFSSINRKLKQTTKIAYDKKFIDYRNYVRISTMAELEVGKVPFLLSNYLDNIKYAKNKLVDDLGYIRGERDDSLYKNDDTELAVEFTTKLVERRSQITQRVNLYRQYNSTQIMLLADVLLKTSQRMNARKSHIEIFYRDTNNPDETYVISPMEQYRMSINMLRKEMHNLTMMETFQGKSPSYDDVIMAAFETGVFTFNELDFVIGYEEFWNPETSKYRKIVRFVFDIAGTASFYLPPPYNIIGAIGLVFTESKILKHSREADSDGNSNSIF